MNIETAWEQADQFYQNGKRSEAKNVLQEIVAAEVEPDNHDSIRAKEQSVYRLGEILRASRQSKELIDLLRDIRPFFSVLPKAKTTKIVRTLFDDILAAGATLEEQKNVCNEMIVWAKEEKRTFLRHRLENRLAQIHFDSGDNLSALGAISSLLREVRRLDDRSLLVDVHLLESRVHYAVKNMSKARAALVSARTNASAIYCAPLSQAEIDLQSGILHAEEKDAKTAYSYLYESFEGFHQLGDHARQARQTLRLMIVSKIACETPDELRTMMQTKSVMEYTGPDIDALKGIADAFQKKDTHSFDKVLGEYNDSLKEDTILLKFITDMHDNLVEKHLLRIIEPYNRVQISYIAELIKLSEDVVESRLSQLILDKKLSGIVDQQHNCLVIFEAVDTKTKDAHGVLFNDSLDTISNLDKLVTALFDKIAGKFDNLVEENIKKSKDGEKGVNKPDSEKTNKEKNEEKKKGEQKK